MKHRFVALSFGVVVLAQPCQAALTFFEFNGHGYAIESTGATWAAANIAAGTLVNPGNANWTNSHLVVINSAGENSEILSQLLSAGISTMAGDGGNGTYAWLGATEIAEGTYQWNNGTTFWSGGSGGSAQNGQYTNWGSYTANSGGGPTTTNEPDNFNNNQDRAAISTTGWPVGPFVTTPAAVGQWNDVSGSNLLAYVVEFDIIPEPSSSILMLLGATMAATRRRR